MVEGRQYIFCSAYYQLAGGEWKYPEKFILLGKDREKAISFAKEKWGQIEKVLFYPKNYIREARKLVADGLYC